MSEGLFGDLFRFLGCMVVLFLTVSIFYFSRWLLETQQASEAPDGPRERKALLTILVGTLVLIGVIANLLALFAFVTGRQSFPVPEPTSPPPSPAVTSAPVLPDLGMETLRTYEDPEKLLHLQVPTSWMELPSRADRPDSVEVVFFAGASTNQAAAFITASVTRLSFPPTLERLSERLPVYIHTTHADLESRKLEEPEILDSNTVRLYWSFRYPDPGGGASQMRAVSWIRQREPYVFQLTIAVPEERYAELAPTITQIYESCVILPERP